MRQGTSARHLLKHVSFHDNPCFPVQLEREAAALKERDPDAYQHLYLGECRLTLDGAIYARELREATEEGRITSVPYDRTTPVSVYFDLGWQDLTAIWFVQHIAGEVRLIDYLEDSQRAFPEYLLELQDRRYMIGTLWLPHDAQAKALGTGRSIEEIARNAAYRHACPWPMVSVLCEPCFRLCGLAGNVVPTACRRCGITALIWTPTDNSHVAHYTMLQVMGPMLCDT